jgi:hypothetical protein
MSRQNKVNPGNYTQAGRLSQDDAAREMKKQRDVESVRQAEGNPAKNDTATEAGVTDEDNSEDEGADEQEE